MYNEENPQDDAEGRAQMTEITEIQGLKESTPVHLRAGVGQRAR